MNCMGLWLAQHLQPFTSNDFKRLAHMWREHAGERQDAVDAAHPEAPTVGAAADRGLAAGGTAFAACTAASCLSTLML